MRPELQLLVALVARERGFYFHARLLVLPEIAQDVGLEAREPRLPRLEAGPLPQEKALLQIVETLRRVADALERGESFRIQVGSARFTVPADARLSIEHEATAGENELELQLKWTD
jgi:amphi-Trp domain-containing protein